MRTDEDVDGTEDGVLAGDVEGSTFCCLDNVQRRIHSVNFVCVSSS